MAESGISRQENKQLESETTMKEDTDQRYTQFIRSIREKSRGMSEDPAGSGLTVERVLGKASAGKQPGAHMRAGVAARLAFSLAGSAAAVLAAALVTGTSQSLSSHDADELCTDCTWTISAQETGNGNEFRPYAAYRDSRRLWEKIIRRIMAGSTADAGPGCEETQNN